MGPEMNKMETDGKEQDWKNTINTSIELLVQHQDRKLQPQG